MKKAAIVLLAAMFFSLLVLSGCSKNNATGASATSASPAGTAGKASGNVIHLKFWGAVPEENGPKQAVDNWNKAHPEIQVEYMRYVNDEAGNTKLETALLAGGEVDVFINYRLDKLVKRVDAGMAEPLDAYIQKDQFSIADNFGDKSIVKMQNKTYYIPAIILNDFVSINKNMLDKAGLKIPESWNWQDYINSAVKLSVGEGNNKVWGSYVNCSQPKVFEYMDKAVKTELGANDVYKQDGTSSFDNPVFKQYLDNMIDLEKTKKVQPPYAEAKTSKMEGSRLFLTGKAAMNWCGTASIRDIKNTQGYPHDFVTAFAPPPIMTPDSKFPSGGTGYLDYTTINAKTKNKDAAWQFLKWYVTEGNEPLIAGGRVPAWKKTDPNKVVKLILGDNPEKLFDVDSFKRVVLTKSDFIVDTKFDKYPEIQQIVEEEGEKALIGEQTSAAAAANMKKRADESLKH